MVPSSACKLLFNPDLFFVIRLQFHVGVPDDKQTYQVKGMAGILYRTRLPKLDVVRPTEKEKNRLNDTVKKRKRCLNISLNTL
jgi:hypothetical protein